MDKFQYSGNGYALTKAMEGCKLVAYQDSVGVWTIGYGHTGSDVFEGLAITQDYADKLLAKDIQKAVDHVNSVVDAEITQGQFDALVDFTFNLGAGRLDKSTLLKKLNVGDHQGAAEEFDKWVFAGGKVLAGLVKRRGLEKALFLGVANA